MNIIRFQWFQVPVLCQFYSQTVNFVWANKVKATVRDTRITEHIDKPIIESLLAGVENQAISFKMDREVLLQASEKAAAFLEDQLETESGQLKEESVCGDLAAQYKLPTLLLLTGRAHVAHRVLDNIKKNFMQKNGDFMSFPTKSGSERKTDDPALSNFWPYINGWIAMAAQRLGRFDIAVPARTYLESFYNARLKGYGISSEDAAAGVPLDVDMFISSHLGLLSLFFGDVARAKEVAECLAQFVAKQPDLNQHFLLRMAGATGELITKFPDDQASFFCLSRTVQNQLHFLLGYPVIFLYFLQQATGDNRYLETAEKILKFVLNCDESMYTFFLSHKASYGAGLLFKVTGKKEYMDMSQKIVSHLLTLQTNEGAFVKELPLLAQLDQSTEIAIWLRELASRVCS